MGFALCAVRCIATGASATVAALASFVGVTGVPL